MPKSIPTLLLVFCSAFRFASADPPPDSGFYLTQGIEESHVSGDPVDWIGVKAYGLAVGGTVLPFVIGLAIGANPRSHIYTTLGWMAAGVVIGPSLGQYYAGSPIQATVGLAIRGVGLGLTAAALAEGMEVASCRHLRDVGGGEEQCDSNDGEPTFLIGTLMFGGGVLYGLIDTHFAVNRKRQRESAEAGRFGFTPTLALAGDGGSRYGGQAWLRF